MTEPSTPLSAEKPEGDMFGPSPWRQAMERLRLFTGNLRAVRVTIVILLLIQLVRMGWTFSTYLWNIFQSSAAAYYLQYPLNQLITMVILGLCVWAAARDKAISVVMGIFTVQLYLQLSDLFSGLIYHMRDAEQVVAMPPLFELPFLFLGLAFWPALLYLLYCQRKILQNTTAQSLTAEVLRNSASPSEIATSSPAETPQVLGYDNPSIHAVPARRTLAIVLLWVIASFRLGGFFLILYNNYSRLNAYNLLTWLVPNFLQVAFPAIAAALAALWLSKARTNGILFIMGSLLGLAIPFAAGIFHQIILTIVSMRSSLGGSEIFYLMLYFIVTGTMLGLHLACIVALRRLCKSIAAAPTVAVSG